MPTIINAPIKENSNEHGIKPSQLWTVQNGK